MKKILLEAAQGKKTQKIPIWLMRQAGRYLPEYREYRKKYDILTMFKTPALAAELTLQPLKRFPLDGAIIYADILLIPDAMGMQLSFVEKEGPRFAKSLRTEQELKQILPVAENVSSIIEKLSFVGETIERVKSALPAQTTLLGFAGAPFTVASYMIAGESTKGELIACKKFMCEEPEGFHLLMNVLTNITIAYLKMQIKAGVEVVQLFESWSGSLPPALYRTFCLPYTKKIITEVQKFVPVIHFLGQGAGLLPEALSLQAKVYSVDWRQDLAYVAKQFAHTGVTLQGNLDPYFLLAPQKVLQEQAAECLRVGREYPNGYIFNLGHGCLPETIIENVEFLVKLVHQQEL